MRGMRRLGSGLAVAAVGLVLAQGALAAGLDDGKPGRGGGRQAPAQPAGGDGQAAATTAADQQGGGQRAAAQQAAADRAAARAAAKQAAADRAAAQQAVRAARPGSVRPGETTTTEATPGTTTTEATPGTTTGRAAVLTTGTAPGTTTGTTAGTTTGARVGRDARAGKGQQAAKVVHVAFAGRVTAVADGSLSVAVERAGKGVTEGSTVTVALDVSTRFTGKGAQSASEVQTNDAVGVNATVAADGSLTAERVNDVTAVHNHWIGGTVESVTATTLAVAVARTGDHDTELLGKSVTLALGSGTVIKGKAETPGTLADIAAGQTVGVQFTARGRDYSTGLTVVRVHIWARGTAAKALKSEQPEGTEAPLPAVPAGT